MTENKSRLFPKTFLWGAATAAHQVEGGNHNQWSVWELENAHHLAKVASRELGSFLSWSYIKQDAGLDKNYVSGIADNHYENYQSDFDLLEEMNMNAFRFSIEWSRIEPQMGEWNLEAVAHYKEYISELKRRRIVPVMTLFHFTLPVWFAELGGFEKRSNIRYFVNFVERVMQEFGKDVRLIMTINEPEVYTLCSYQLGMWSPSQKSLFKAAWVFNNLATAHNRAEKVIKSHRPDAKVSIAKHSVHFYPANDSWMSKLAVKFATIVSDDFFLWRVKKRLDFLGVNFYRSFEFDKFSLSEPSRVRSDLDWAMRPADIQPVLERLYKKYNLPIIITENGLADAKDDRRQWWLESTLTAIAKAVRNGVNIQGYLHWSLIDNFEWSFGRWPRFGLAEVDYATQKRKLRPSAKWFSGFIKRQRRV